MDVSKINVIFKLKPEQLCSQKRRMYTFYENLKIYTIFLMNELINSLINQVSIERLIPR